MDEIAPLHFSLKQDGPGYQHAYAEVNGSTELLNHARHIEIVMDPSDLTTVRITTEVDSLNVDLLDPRIVVIHRPNEGRCWHCDQPNNHDGACSPVEKEGA